MVKNILEAVHHRSFAFSDMDLQGQWRAKALPKLDGGVDITACAVIPALELTYHRFL
jgi:hypothetical protein